MKFLPATNALPAETVRRLHDELHAHTERYCIGAAELLRYWPAIREPVATIAELHAQVAALQKAAAALAPLLEYDACPFVVREALATHGIADPIRFVEELHDRAQRLEDAARDALRTLPTPKRGRPARPQAVGRDWLEAKLLALYADVTGDAETATTAAACCAIVMEVIAAPSGDAESVQRRDRRRRKILRAP